MSAKPSQPQIPEVGSVRYRHVGRRSTAPLFAQTIIVERSSSSSSAEHLTVAFNPSTVLSDPDKMAPSRTPSRRTSKAPSTDRSEQTAVQRSGNKSTSPSTTLDSTADAGLPAEEVSTAEKARLQRPAPLFFGWLVLPFIVTFAHIVLSPYTKVEETPALHAVHDILKFGPHPRSIAKVGPVTGSTPAAHMLTTVRTRAIPWRCAAFDHPFPRHCGGMQAAPHRSPVFGVHHHGPGGADHQCVGASSRLNLPALLFY